ncbi:hypothetical protein GOBAR_AA27074 [Gossypium barbadense]|uniref:Uncharacterized protein n=1 Tax=Gossypium barbadense TaxID=3634 RepID=A0A2P5WRA0_GOSBA|nr:hypothetical protein GOBAR_AA27074 [Gossypium barbadense]
MSMVLNSISGTKEGRNVLLKQLGLEGPSHSGGGRGKEAAMQFSYDFQAILSTLMNGFSRKRTESNTVKNLIGFGCLRHFDA